MILAADINNQLYLLTENWSTSLGQLTELRTSSFFLIIPIRDTTKKLRHLGPVWLSFSKKTLEHFSMLPSTSGNIVADSRSNISRRMYETRSCGLAGVGCMNLQFTNLQTEN